FSIAAVLKPDIFIIDEALSTGDLAFRQKATERIQEMMEGAKAVIIVSHSMRFVEQVCTRAIWIDQGKVRADGNAEKIVDEYRTAMGMKKKKKKLKSKKHRRNSTKKKKSVKVEHTATADESSKKKSTSTKSKKKKESDTSDSKVVK